MTIPSRRATGFTLLELLIVIAIFAIFSVMAYGGLNSVLKTRTEVERAQDRLAELQRAYMRLRDDLQQASPRPVRDVYGDLAPAFRGVDSPQVIELTRRGWRNPAGLPRSTLERVAYRLDERRLIRSTFRVLDQAQDSKAADAVLLTDVESMTLRYLDADRQWRTRWPPDSADTEAARQPPPMAVEIVLETKDQGELTFLFKVGTDRVNIQASAGTGGTPPPSSPGSPPPAVGGGEQPPPDGDLTQ
jgi:general secretion pathway protein J